MLYSNKANTKSDLLTKALYVNNKNFNSFSKLIVAVHIKKIDKIKDLFITQAICLIDTVTAQKPNLRVSKCKYNFGSKFFSFSCKVTLRKRKALNFLALLEYTIFSQFVNKHFSNDKYYNHDNIGHFSFVFQNVSIFKKLDEFYYKWHVPVLLTHVCLVSTTTATAKIKRQKLNNVLTFQVNS